MLTLTTSSFSLLSPSIMILTSLGLSFLAPLVMGQTVIDIAVGLGGRLTFEPPYVTAQLNDIVNFVL